MKELTIEKLVPLLISPVWYRRLVGEYYEVVIRLEGAHRRIQTLHNRQCTRHSVDDISMQSEIEMLQSQVSIMALYQDILYRRLVRNGIQFADILSEVLDAQDVLT